MLEHTNIQDDSFWAISDLGTDNAIFNTEWLSQSVPFKEFIPIDF